MPPRTFIELTKPGLVAGNLLSVMAGFAIGAGGRISPALAAAALIGMALVMASGCVFNNCIDRDVDAAMARTKNRSLPSGRVSRSAAIAEGALLGLAGFFVLVRFANLLAAAVALSGFAAYVGLYSLWYKRRSPFGTFVGALSGAVPPVAGYAAAAGRLGPAAAILFLTLIAWQMPHFFSIAIRRRGEYAAAGIPVLPVARGVPKTKIAMLLWIAAFTIVAPSLALFGYAGAPYFFATLSLGLLWFFVSLRGFSARDDVRFGRLTFLVSLAVLLGFLCAAILSAPSAPARGGPHAARAKKSRTIPRSAVSRLEKSLRLSAKC